MSDAIAFVSGLTYREVLNIACYSVLDPTKLTSRQSIIRLYRNLLRSQFDYAWSNYEMVSNVDEFFANYKKYRVDFDKMLNSHKVEEVKYLKDKYEFMIHETFDSEPYVRIFKELLTFNRFFKRINIRFT